MTESSELPEPESSFPSGPLDPPESQLGESPELSEPPGGPLDPPEPLEHNPDGDRWQRHADGRGRDPEADREARRAMAAEQNGEWDADGSFRPSTWRRA